MPDTITPKDMATRLNVSERTAYARLASGDWPILKVGKGRWSRPSFEAYLAGSGCEQPAVPTLTTEMIEEAMYRAIRRVLAEVEFGPRFVTTEASNIARFKRA